ncbi:unnamed protein product [Dibothriocephalus latus]|uniref:Uncharacterized protein n=1 Tax=Dibothriocephalus latus TaxID=60516 RepID=A0A3P7NPJ3_DIBLA|nr:unnamed protein product [Dibothriocephalus latus]
MNINTAIRSGINRMNIRPPRPADTDDEAGRSSQQDASADGVRLIPLLPRRYLAIAVFVAVKSLRVGNPRYRVGLAFGQLIGSLTAKRSTRR